MSPDDVVITGLGVVSPIGIGREAFWESLCAGRSGVRAISSFDPSALPSRIAGEIPDFDPKRYIKARKSIKVMARDTMLGVTAAVLASEDARLEPGAGAPERFGVVLAADRICGSLEDSEAAYGAALVDGRFDYDLWVTKGVPLGYPLGFLRVLPNMIGSHVSIVEDARGPNNTIHHGDVSSLLAVIEASRVILRGAADVMIAGGASSEMAAFNCASRGVRGMLTCRDGDPAAAMRPFDADRDGQVWGEGAAAVILERRAHAGARGADVLATIAGWGTACERLPRGEVPEGTALGRAAAAALDDAGLQADRLGHVHAHGLSTVKGDAMEARVLQQVVADVPVTALKSYFGNLGAAGGAVEMVGSVLALREGAVPPTLNYRRPDPRCPLAVVRDRPTTGRPPSALLVSWNAAGQAAAVVVLGGAN